jgi:ribosome-associated protein
MAKKKELKSEQINNIAPSLDLKDVIVSAMQDKKGEDIVVLDMQNLHNTLFDQFIICSANSKPQSDTLVDHIAFTVKKQLGILPKHVEGTENGSWAILDYFNIIVHVFNPESRNYFQLEKLWADAELRTIETV